MKHTVSYVGVGHLVKAKYLSSAELDRLSESNDYTFGGVQISLVDAHDMNDLMLETSEREFDVARYAQEFGLGCLINLS